MVRAPRQQPLRAVPSHRVVPTAGATRTGRWIRHARDKRTILNFRNGTPGIPVFERERPVVSKPIRGLAAGGR